jgi:hypothetical protein
MPVPATHRAHSFRVLRPGILRLESSEYPDRKLNVSNAQYSIRGGVHLLSVDTHSHNQVGGCEVSLLTAQDTRRGVSSGPGPKCKYRTWEPLPNANQRTGGPILHTT